MTILKNAGAEIIRACDGVECLEKLESSDDHHFDMILMDIQMPKMNGYETTKKIRAMKNEAKSQIPIIAMTANAFEEDRQKALNCGMNGHISKPINVETLTLQVGKFLSR